MKIEGLQDWKILPIPLQFHSIVGMVWVYRLNGLTLKVTALLTNFQLQDAGLPCLDAYRLSIN